MIVKAVDVETTIYNKGNCFDSRNVMCLCGVGDKVWDIQYSDEPYGHKLKEIQQEIDEADLLVLVNAKFDLHWLTRYGIKFNHKRIWDCQLVYFMLHAQTIPYPSMNMMAEEYGLEQKPNIAEKYWDAGIQTTEIPYDELSSYLQHHDLPTTEKIYHIQKELVKQNGKEFERLVSLANQDLLVLQEMEYNGLRYEEEVCKIESAKLEIQINELRMELHDYHSIPEFNTASGDHLSCLLYGGTINVQRREHVGVYKTGDRAGEDKYGWRDYAYTLPRIVTPIPKSELKKEGYWQTGEDVLKSLKCRDKAGKRVIEIILTLAKLEKMKGTYYDGLPKLREKMNWEPNFLHGNLNQCVAATGRLSSTKPNLQNLSGDMKNMFLTRFI